jgi:Zn-dependent alcohol dehydrogenase
VIPSHQISPSSVRATLVNIEFPWSIVFIAFAFVCHPVPGATHVINARRSNPVEEIKKICGRHADFALECTGNIKVVRQAIDSVGMLGTVRLIGGAPAGAEFSADHLTTLWGKRIIGMLGGESTSKKLIAGLLELNAQGRFPYDELLVEFPLSKINEALSSSYSGEILKPVLRMPH